MTAPDAARIIEGVAAVAAAVLLCFCAIPPFAEWLNRRHNAHEAADLVTWLGTRPNPAAVPAHVRVLPSAPRSVPGAAGPFDWDDAA